MTKAWPSGWMIAALCATLSFGCAPRKTVKKAPSAGAPEAAQGGEAIAPSVESGEADIRGSSGRNTSASGPAVDRRHTSVSAAYLYPYDSLTDIYLVGMNDRVRGQTEGVSVAAGVRFRF